MRKPTVANRFYPGNREQLTREIKDLLPPTQSSEKVKALAVMSPHAGYIYSGALAAKTFHQVEIPETVVLLGPNHTGQGSPVALSADTWDMTLGNVEVNSDFNTLLLQNSPLFRIDETAHRFEHSLEVQIPFLQMQKKNLKIVPVILSHLSYTDCKELAKALAFAIKQYKEDILIVASTDMSHFESRKIAQQKDSMAVREIEQLNPKGLFQTVIENNISMCGMIPTVITMLAVKILGATSSQLVDYTDSGYVAGETSQVVGYAGVILS